MNVPLNKFTMMGIIRTQTKVMQAMMYTPWNTMVTYRGQIISTSLPSSFMAF